MSPYTIIQTILAILVIVSILMQNRGTGLGGSWGGAGELYGTRRGVEKILFKVTVVFIIFFIAVSIASLVF